jgi:hypothetical protein
VSPLAILLFLDHTRCLRSGASCHHYNTRGVSLQEFGRRWCLWMWHKLHPQSDGGLLCRGVRVRFTLKISMVVFSPSTAKDSRLKSVRVLPLVWQCVFILSESIPSSHGKHPRSHSHFSPSLRGTHRQKPIALCHAHSRASPRPNTSRPSPLTAQATSPGTPQAFARQTPQPSTCRSIPGPLGIQANRSQDHRGRTWALAGRGSRRLLPERAWASKGGCLGA